MKITIVNTHDIIGGAERASYDLAKGLHQRGDETRLYVAGQYGFDSFTRKMHYRRLDYTLRRLVSKHLGLTDTTLWAPLDACRRFRDFREADVVNLHNMHGSYWNFWTLGLLVKRAPVFLTLHDEWFLTGDCAYIYDCERWLDSCGRCPQFSGSLDSNRYALGGRDFTRTNLFLKRLSTSRIDAGRFCIVAPSRWLLDRAARSTHLRRFPAYHIEYGIDLSQYTPLPKEHCREQLSLPASKRLVFCAAADLGDKRKNFASLFRLVLSGGLPKDMMLVCAGKVPIDESMVDHPQIRWLGYLTSRDEMARAICACDFTVVLSRADNLPYVALESVSCGRPVLGSTAGGIPEIVDHGNTGWLVPHDAEPEFTSRVLRDIATLDDATLAQMGRRARAQAERRYDMDMYVSRHREVFQEAMERCE